MPKMCHTLVANKIHGPDGSFTIWNGFTYITAKSLLQNIHWLPMSSPDPSVYILTGILPIEAQIHIKALTFFNYVCPQGEKNTEIKLARRQLTVKEESSNSWFICVNKILRKYDLDNPIKKSRWISLVKSRVLMTTGVPS
jgi:hypothetical protein